jgi:hypothetical protein
MIMSNQQKAKFVSNIFHIRSFWGRSRRNFAKNLFYAGRYDMPEILMQQLVEFLTKVTRKHH